MPRRTDIRHILVIGSGPIVIGQACEFDYSGTQACRVLREEGIRVSLINSNPATIMTDPEFADATYIEPITPAFVEQVIADQLEAGFPIDALLATLGGQTALNTAIALDQLGVLEKYDVELIGADIPAIQRGEDRQIFKDIVRSVGGDVPRSAVCHTLEQVRETVADLGLPVVIRPSFTMGGLGSGLAYTDGELDRIAGTGLAASPVHEVLIEESVLGWKEYELELMRDGNDNAVVVCSIENLDPMGVHTGDSITVAPAMTLTDREYQAMRDLGLDILRAVGVATGGCNIQFAIDPDTGRMIVIEMNPRVSRSSALASKATGFPIAKIAAKLAIGYTLDEIANDITKATPAAFEPSLDYVVVKIPRFAFEKFPGADPTLTTTMKSVGEAMSIGRSFAEALGKAMRSMETKLSGFWTGPVAGPGELDALLESLRIPTDGRIYGVERALALGATVEQVHEVTEHRPVVPRPDRPDPGHRHRRPGRRRTGRGPAPHREAVRALGSQIAVLRPEFGTAGGGAEGAERRVREYRWSLGIRPVYKTVDTCAAEFEALTPYHYSAYETDPAAESEVAPQTERPKVIILGSGPNRIGQGIEFDYSCVHAALALRDVGFETVMVNCNPETVSTDYDTSDRLYFEPLTAEDVLEVVHAERQSGTVAGVIVTLGGQTPLKLAETLQQAGVPILGTQPEAIDLAEDRSRFGELLATAKLPAPLYGMATSFDQAHLVAERIGFPVLVRPSYVLGGRGMEIVYDDEALADYISRATEITDAHPVMVDKFLDDAIEIDVDALCDGTEVYLGGVMEHIEEAGIHSGDSACVLPPITLGRSDIDVVRRHTEAIALGCGVRGLLNVQYALKDQTLYVLEANPRASRTVPFSSKATAVPLAKAAARIMTGSTIAELRLEGLLPATGDGGALPNDAPVAVKEAVMPFHRFRRPDGTGVDSLLGPEMRSTGEVMGIDAAFGPAFAKSQTASYGSLPTSGTVFVSVANADKRSMVFPMKRLADLGFRIVATEGTAEMLRRNGMTVEVVRKHFEGPDNIVEKIRAGEIDLVINTPYGQSGPRIDGYEIRTAAIEHRHPLHHHGGRCGRGDPGHRGADPLARRRRPVAGAAGPAADSLGRVGNDGGCGFALMGTLDQAYRKLARPVLFRIGHGDAEAAHHRTLQWLAAVGERPTLGRAAGRLLARHRSPRNVFGVEFPSAVGSRRRGRQGRCRAEGLARAGFRLHRTRHRHGAPAAGQPEAPAVPATRLRGGDQPDGVQQRRVRRAGRPAHRDRPDRDPGGRLARQIEGDSGRGGRRRLPDLAPRRARAGRLHRRQRVLAQHPGAAVAAGPRPARRAARRAHRRGRCAGVAGRPRRAAGAGAGEDRPGPDRRRHRRRAAGLYRPTVAGVIAVNTTLSRDGLEPSDVIDGAEPGGLSGAPLRSRALEVVRFLRAHTDLPLIGVGGIGTPEDGLAMLDAGADLLQLYTGFIYQGPGLVSGAQRGDRGPSAARPSRDQHTGDVIDLIATIVAIVGLVAAVGAAAYLGLLQTAASKTWRQRRARRSPTSASADPGGRRRGGRRGSVAWCSPPETVPSPTSWRSSSAGLRRGRRQRADLRPRRVPPH